jgi:hypothetical protein
VIGNDHNFVTVPDLGIFAEVLFENPDRTRPTHIVCHQYIDIYPNVVAGLNGIAPGMASENLFGQGHRRHVSLAPVRENFAEEELYQKEEQMTR